MSSEYNIQPGVSRPERPVRLSTSILLLAGVLLLTIIGWLAYQNVHTTRTLKQQVANLEESEKLREELQRKYNDAIAELESLKGENEQVNALIEKQIAELDVQKKQIDQLLRDKGQLNAARKEIGNLKKLVSGYLADIDQLKEEQEQLQAENALLAANNDSLNNALKEKDALNQALSTEKEQLETEREALRASVQIGSVIKVKDINVTGFKKSKSGKSSEKSTAKRINQLKVCFTTIANELAKPGVEQFFIRIVSPRGETLAIDDLGSSAIVNKKTGEKVLYTQVKEYDYANDEAQLCFFWAPSLTFQSGKYAVEIYNKGFLAGTGSFELK
jgi:Tfp pilus assembly protein PilO